jgi:hypothetical protein
MGRGVVRRMALCIMSPLQYTHKNERICRGWGAGGWIRGASEGGIVFSGKGIREKGRAAGGGGSPANEQILSWRPQATDNLYRPLEIVADGLRLEYLDNNNMIFVTEIFF